ncbi:NAD-dependent epimerase/dehydratase family protein [Streptomyces phaeochromogenes]|uniref:NAD-dependent epimerase/dehydratase family protein n=1 Tax=Streptomyces phaeochromogenes TaxID=1923 RepID=UPI002DD8FF3A|nr:NAD-dependent epimerase/dehydratase family protein [Streptomyces phaeochromogenes]WRZ35444.1 NAD-dependent epimerase/dehydratase family protein [Streptomyces phaeochromogenes]
MKVLVIGATGYAGRRVSTALSRAGHAVLGLARDTDGPAARELAVNEVTPVRGDFSEPETWRAHLEGTDAVVHLLLDMSDPVGGDQRLFAELAAAQERDGRRRHLVFTTGISSYGRTGLALMDENTPGNPESPIGFRLALEKELAASGLAHTVVRPGFMYGGPATTSMTGQWFAAAEEGKPVFYGDTTKRWSWVHVDDLADAYVRILDNPTAVDGETFVIADDQRLRSLDIQQTAVRAAGFTGEITLESAEAGGMLQLAADQDELVTSVKAHRLLGWRPRHASFTDAPEQHYRAWKAAQPTG